MRANRIRERWAVRETAISGWLSIGSTYSAEIIGYSGVDCVTVDLQHGMIDVQTMIGMLQAISSTPATPIVRVPAYDAPLIMKTLDAGAYGIICPMIDSVSEATAFVAATRYPPKGFRSFGPARGLLYGGADYFDHADATLVRMAMIETQQGLAAVEDICAIDGLDGIFVGPNDLALALGKAPSNKPTEPEIVAAIDHCVSVARDCGKHAGIFCSSGADANRRASEGFSFVVPNSEANILKFAIAAEVKAARGGLIP